MHRCRCRAGLPAWRFSAWCVLLLLLFVCGRVVAEDTLPDRSQVEERLAEMRPGEGESVTDAEQRDIDALEATLDALEQLQGVEERLEALETRLEEAPAELLRLERELLEEEEAALERSIAELDDVPLDELEYRQQEAVFVLQQLQDRLADVNAQLLSAQTLPERAQQAIAEAMQAAERTRRSLDVLEAQGASEESPRLWQLQVERRLAERTLRLRQRELGSNTRLRELAQQRRDLLTQQIASQEAELNLLQSVIDRQRRLASEQAIADAVRDDPLLEAGHPVLERAQQVNRELSLELLRANDRHNGLVRESLAIRSQLDHVRQLQRSLNEQIEAIRGSLLLSRILREQRRSLPQVDARRNLQDEIADLRLRQFDLVRQRDALRQSERLANQRLEEAGVEVNQALVDSLQGLYHSRRQLVDQLEQTYGSLLSAAIELQLNQQQLLETSRELRTTIDEQLFWIANTRPLDLAWFRHLPANLVTEWQQGEWREVLPVHWRVPGAESLSGLPLVLVAALLLGLRRRIQRRLALLHEQIGRLRSDSQAHTPLAVGLNALLALPGPLTLAGIGASLGAIEEGIASGLGQAFLHLALAWAFLAWSRRLLVRDGVATKHFYWPAGYVARLRWLLGWLGVALIPVLLISALARDGEISLTTRPIALTLLLAGLLAMSVLLARLILAHTPFFGVKLFRLVLGLIMASVPLILVGLIVSGYEYTALSMIGRFVITLYLLAMWILVEASVVRGLAVAARRLAFRRALMRRRAQAQEGAEGGLEVVEEPPLDMEQINQQSLRLSKLILLLGFALLLYVVWADLLTVLGYLDDVAIWEAGEGVGAELVTSALSVADIFTAALIFVLTLVMARNLPGLLEVMVLSRLELKQGSAYAISALLSYTIVGTGLVVALATLGVAWSQLQWLVAALGVGLGFGLQEIFANFVSGLIILFERPVRIGDTITLGNLTGTVSRIRIRATTVTDFDRKEIIIPNKTFVTDQLINWSLSDTITRVVLSFGVSYGSDQRLVHRLLRQAADENPRVLGDPEPQVFFMDYGESTLNFELRIFVNALGDRLYATDEINCRVGELFAEHGIDIAFNQLDVWLHRSGGPAKKVQSVTPSDGECKLDHPPPGAAGDPGDIEIGDAGDGGGDGGR
ncbi:mechanosensitive channel MscK [Billgrantia tianxiuensis]|uniref:Mechanosensitive channel MscK n=1 Tax=Billgrantia tianxiuensis TaxID=2497861 RepID=A0A6I6STG9_9GAMM|nr:MULTISPECIES: mechanosensitive channel MscK [Halomonas]MCE8032435.1 mechanosensitive channel MscK [Halomonas sp. MCCC 1A11057]QHC52074.1 mechanosensitive channel MscK [Halomonas tianxiuensis]